MKLARMPYINVDPFYYTLEHGVNESGIELITGYPRQIGRLADSKGALDAGPISVMDFLGLERSYEPLGGMYVAVKEKAGSVTLFSRVPAKDLDGRRIGITSQTSTSMVLLRIILEQRYGVGSALYLDQPDEKEVDAYLFIGNSALVNVYNGLKGFGYVYDLGEEWYDWTGLPFVFAVWAVRKAVPGSEKGRLRDILGGSLDVFWRNEKEMAKERSEELLVPAPFIENYWHLFIYRQTSAIDRSLALFTGYAKNSKEVFIHGQKRV
ncbi:MAG: menaquinone biosynthesis protein [Deltaproteobacteria bacterium]|nr:menaquinone biosynthesis protein [Deltaproteobacteria bacterium]MCL5276672.1 menaquinone biosynthesis protein [Deltaproteobacteria bacterium]